MKILIISDTHTDSIAKLPEIITEEAKKCDAVIHAGDIVGLNIINELSEINKNIYPVKGNMDPMLSGEPLPIKRVLNIEDVRIGISHGEGAPSGIENRLLYTFENDNVDIIIFGHTHEPFSGIIGGVHFLNPGSPTNKRSAPYHTYAILNIDDGKFHAEIKRIEE